MLRWTRYILLENDRRIAEIFHTGPRKFEGWVFAGEYSRSVGPFTELEMARHTTALVAVARLYELSFMTSDDAYYYIYRRKGCRFVSTGLVLRACDGGWVVE